MAVVQVVMKVIKVVFISRNTGLLNFRSPVFAFFTLPLALIILTKHNKYVSEKSAYYLDFDINDNRLFPNFLREDVVEIFAVFLSFVFLSNMLYVPLFGVFPKARVGNVSIDRSSIGMNVFRFLSLIVVPKTIYAFVKENVKFRDAGDYSNIASNITLTSTKIAVLSLSSVWNYINVFGSILLSFLTIRINDMNLKFPFPVFDANERKYVIRATTMQDVMVNFFGDRYPNFTGSKDDFTLAVFMFIFWLVIMSSVMNQMSFLSGKPSVSGMTGVIKTLISIGLNLVIPMTMLNATRQYKYSTEISTVGTLLGMTITNTFF